MEHRREEADREEQSTVSSVVHVAETTPPPTLSSDEATEQPSLSESDGENASSAAVPSAVEAVERQPPSEADGESASDAGAASNEWLVVESSAPGTTRLTEGTLATASGFAETPVQQEAPSETDSTVTSTAVSAGIEGLRHAVGGRYGGSSFAQDVPQPVQPPWVQDNLRSMFPIPEGTSYPDHTRIQPNEDLETYAQRIRRNGNRDVFRSENDGLIFRSTRTSSGVRGEGWEGENQYRARNGNRYDTTRPPPDMCFNCGGNHWRKDCPRGGRR